MKTSTYFLLLSLTILISSCTKEPIEGWTIYSSSPPPPSITHLNGIITNCIPPYPVNFEQKTTNIIGSMSYFWDFGDGNTSTRRNPQYTYQTQGEYTIKLIVSNKIGADTAYLHLPELNEASIPVEASFTFTHYNNNNFAPNKILFTNNSSGANQFEWTFGDGDESKNIDPEHVFQNPGNYTVTLRGICLDTEGTFDEITQNILISSAPTRVFVDSINLMLPSTHKNQRIFIELLHNSTAIGKTATITPRDYPVKFYFPSAMLFEYVTFASNEVFKFRIMRDLGEAGVETIEELVLASGDIQNNYYPRQYNKIESAPFPIKDLFIDLYISY